MRRVTAHATVSAALAVLLVASTGAPLRGAEQSGAEQGTATASYDEAGSSTVNACLAGCAPTAAAFATNGRLQVGMQSTGGAVAADSAYGVASVVSAAWVKHRLVPAAGATRIRAHLQVDTSERTAPPNTVHVYASLDAGDETAWSPVPVGSGGVTLSVPFAQAPDGGVPVTVTITAYAYPITGGACDPPACAQVAVQAHQVQVDAVLNRIEAV